MRVETYLYFLSDLKECRQNDLNTSAHLLFVVEDASEATHTAYHNLAMNPAVIPERRHWSGYAGSSPVAVKLFFVSCCMCALVHSPKVRGLDFSIFLHADNRASLLFILILMEA